MAPVTVSTAQLAAFGGVIQGFVRLVRRLALVTAGAVALLVLLLLDNGFTAAEAVLATFLLAPSALLLFFAQGVQELLSLPERLRRMPGEGQERLAELTRITGQVRTTRARGLPLFLWRLRGAFGSVRDVAGIALPFRVLTPWFLAMSAIAAVLCVLLCGIVVVVLIGAAAA